MLYSLEMLIKENKLICIRSDKTVQEALQIMVEKDFTQLPVVDELGNLLGIISEHSITRTYHLVNGGVSLLNLTVDHCQESAITLPPGEDIFKALELLKNTYAIVIIDHGKPCGILTDYDMTHFFHDITGGLLLVEDIEVTLRKYIESAFPEDNPMQAALMKAFGSNKREPTKPAFEYKELTFGQHVRLITTEENWPKFKGVFEPKELFTKMMGQVGDIRNQLAHFRKRLDASQRNALEQTRFWLASRPKLNLPHTTQVRPAGNDGLQAWLTMQALKEKKPSDIRVSFQDIETLLNEPLPSTAHEHESWWSNDYLDDPQSLMWLQAGWRVRDVNLTSKEVIFQHTNNVLMQLFFADLLARLKIARPGITNATRTQPENWWAFGAGRTGFGLGWTLSRDILRVELWIDLGEKDKTKEIFDRLQKQQLEIENEIGASLNWDRLNTGRGCRISLAKPAKITDSPEKLEEAKQWAIATMVKFADTFQPRIKNL